MASRARIGGWLSVAEGLEFESYATQIGIDHSALATLLIVRELNRDNLSSLATRSGGVCCEKGRRVTASPKGTDWKARFADHARVHSMTPDAAASMIFRFELAEKWLAKELGVNRESN